MGSKAPKPQKVQLPDPAIEQAKEQAAADEAARRLRAEERARSGQNRSAVAGALSGGSGFDELQSKKRTLLGVG